MSDKEKVEERTQEDVAAEREKEALATLAASFDRREFPVATNDGRARKWSLPAMSALDGAQLNARYADIVAETQNAVEDEQGAKRQSKFFHELVEDLLCDLQSHAIRIEAVSSFLTEQPADASARTVQDALKQKCERVKSAFSEGMKATLAAQRGLEKNIYSLYGFFVEAGCDGTAESVYVINHNAVNDKYAEELGETSVQQMPVDPALGNVHPVFGTSVDRNGKPMPIVFRPLDAVGVIQNMCSAIAISAEVKGQSKLDWWAKRAQESSAVCFVNVSTDDCGPKPWDPAKTPAVLRRNYTAPHEHFKSLVAVANHPVVRKKSDYEDYGVTAYPAFALLGKVYYMEKVADRSFACSPISPVRDALRTEWIADAEQGLSCPWIRDRRNELNGINIVFIEPVSNRLGDDVVTHFNTACSAYETNRVPYTLKLAENWLEKVITHHLLTTGLGGPPTNQEAQRVGRELNQKLGALASPINDAKPFVTASVDYQSSRTEREIAKDNEGKPILDDNGNQMFTGRTVQIHKIHVEYKDGVEDFEVQVG